MVSLNKRTSMALFSDPTDHYCQRVRIVLEEKGISSEIIDTDKNNINAEILEVSPYSTLPVLVDRDVCLYDSVTLMEYLDERFPHPPLLPVYPVARANIRLYIKRIANDWCSIFDRLIDEKLKEAESQKRTGSSTMKIYYEKREKTLLADLSDIDSRMAELDEILNHSGTEGEGLSADVVQEESTDPGGDSDTED